MYVYMYIHVDNIWVLLFVRCDHGNISYIIYAYMNVYAMM